MSSRNHVPKYRKHKQSGKAIVTLLDGLGGRRDILLGEYGTDQSRMEYARVISEWEAAGRRLLQTAAASDLTCNELMLAYWQLAEGYYSDWKLGRRRQWNNQVPTHSDATTI
jgi:hypothetical protein